MKVLERIKRVVTFQAQAHEKDLLKGLNQLLVHSSDFLKDA